MSVIQVDDVDPSIIYSGAWQSIVSSTRQWGVGTVHTTTEGGASATITFRGTRIMMYCSLPIGVSSEIVDVKFDGGQITSTTHPASTTAASYNQVWFDSGPVTDTVHTLVVSNGGGPSDMPFELDRFAVTGFIVSPPPPPPASSTPPPPATSSIIGTSGHATSPVAITTFVTEMPNSLISQDALGQTSMPLTSSAPIFTALSSPPNSSLTAGVVTTTGLQYITTTAPDGSVTTYIQNAPAGGYSRSPAAPVAAIVGAVIGGLTLIFLLIFSLLCSRRRRKAWRHVILDDDAEKRLNSPRTSTGITPFRLDERRASPTPSLNGPRDFAREMEIATAGLRYILAAGSPIGSPTSPSSLSHGPVSAKTSPSNITSSPSLAHSPPIRQADSGTYTPIGSNLSANTVLSTLSSMYATMIPDHPTPIDTPPSYQSATTPPSSRT
ncbi:hypothetical protein GALMADRAFT_148356 [Galerina marginata CBS 339.88]|uniref:Transmembrane protein n=1 Tax=Galerina marginata (strain CBS 339.88) TaxID=685588 RepID=A0A067S4X9_GALM3|nr:hypothetical protein GALMADRAFT_148356 [Galerina marginata CBS 339.88]